MNTMVRVQLLVGYGLGLKSGAALYNSYSTVITVTQSHILCFSMWLLQLYFCSFLTVQLMAAASSPHLKADIWKVASFC